MATSFSRETASKSCIMAMYAPTWGKRARARARARVRVRVWVRVRLRVSMRITSSNEPHGVAHAPASRAIAQRWSDPPEAFQ